MAQLSANAIQARRQLASAEIIAKWNQRRGFEEYTIQCPCQPDCNHMPKDEIPRLILSFCLYPGELDYFYQQPFQSTHNFMVRWHCDVRGCHGKLACGAPFESATPGPHITQ